MRIALTAPTGHVGHHLSRALVRGGTRPLLLVRDAGRVDAALAGLVDVLEVDLADPEAVVAATRGVDALSWISPGGLDDDDPLAAHARYAASVVAAVHGGVPRVVLQSSVGAERRHGMGDIDGLGATEQALDEAAARTGASVLHLRCGFFFSNLEMQRDALLDGTVPVLLPTDHRMAWVDPRDIAEVTAASLLAGGPPGTAVRAVHGPEDLSWDDALAVVAHECGVDVRAVTVPEADMRRGMSDAGLPAAAIDAIVGMSTGQLDGWSPEQVRDATTTTPSTLAGWCAAHLRPLLADR